jgi:membrane-associated phospholipid phosphatase
LTESPPPSASEPLLPAAAWTARRLVLAAAVLMVFAAAALPLDLAAARFVQAHRLTGDLRRIVTLAEVFGWGGTIALIILTAVALDPRGWRVAPRLAIGSLAAGLAADGLKLLGVARWRPAPALEAGLNQTFVGWLPLWRHDPALGAYDSRLQSFPSGHAANAVGLAIALAVLYPRGRWLFAAFAVLACLQRVEGLAHFPSDVLVGAAIGCLASAICAGPLHRRLTALEQ